MSAPPPTDSGSAATPTSPSTLDYNRWEGPRRGVWARRAVITTTGLRHLLQGKFFKLLVVLGWVAGIAVAVLGYGFAQTLADDGWLARLAANAGPRPMAVMNAISALLLLYPDILVNGTFKVIFWAHSQVGLGLSLVAMTLLVPQLITRDRSSQAVTIYLSRPLTSRDYLLGKLGVIAGVLLLLWTGPLVAGWLVSMLVLPDWTFFLHSLTAMTAALTFNAIALAVIGALAFGVSAFAKTATSARLWWLGLWILLGIVGSNRILPEWIRHMSFSQNLSLVRDEVFAMDQTLRDAAGVVPLLNQELANSLDEAATFLAADEMTGVTIAFCLMVGLSLSLLLRRIKPE